MIAGLVAAWPLFGLRIRTERLVLRLPTDDDLVRLLAVARAGIHPPDEMPFGVAWTRPTGDAFDAGFLQHHWQLRGSWSPDDWQLNLLIEREGEPIGSQSVHARAFATMRTIHTGSWLGRAFQGNGYGKEMRSAVLALGFEGLGATVALTEAFLDNTASHAVSRSLGYQEGGRGSLAPEGEARETQRWRMTLDSWRSQPRVLVTFEGLEACLPLFGVAPGS